MKSSPDWMALAVGLSILLGFIQCFFGYRLFKFILVLTGVAAGGAGAAWLAHAHAAQPGIVVFAGIGGAALGGVLMVPFYFVGIFLFGAFLGGVVGNVLFSIAASQPQTLVVLCLALVGGILGLIFQKLMIILSTSFAGAWNVVTGAAYYLTGEIAPTDIDKLFRVRPDHLAAILLGWLALGAVGVLVQYRTRHQKRHEHRVREPDSRGGEGRLASSSARETA